MIFTDTHQFFMNPVAIYVVVFDASLNALSSIEYWLQQIYTFCQDKQFIPPVILVGTRADKIPDWRKKYEEIEKQIFAKYEKRKGFRVASCCLVSCTEHEMTLGTSG